MEETNGHEGRGEQRSTNRDRGERKFKNGPPAGFEGLNFEQQRGTYRGDGNPVRRSDDDREPIADRRGDR